MQIHLLELNTVVPPGLGRLLSSIKPGTFLTADQWKNWTVYFSVYSLIRPSTPATVWLLEKVCFSMQEVSQVYYFRWWYLCGRWITPILSELYGENAITPNMPCHLAACLREFGPIHSFLNWLFLIDYNAILEGYQLITAQSKCNWCHIFRMTT